MRKKKPAISKVKPYVEDGVRYSGLESKSMKKLGSSFLVPENADCQAVLRYLPANDEPFAPIGVNFTLSFPGSFYCALRFESSNQLLVVAGKCHYTRPDDSKLKDHFTAFSDRKSSLSFPHKQVFRTCPVCAKICKYNKQYWMVFSCVRQVFLKGNSAVEGGLNKVELVEQLVCLRCFEDLLRNKPFDVFDFPTLGFLSQMPGIPLYANDGKTPAFPLEANRIHSVKGLHSIWMQTGAYFSLLRSCAGIEDADGNGNVKEIISRADANAKACLFCFKTFKKGQAQQCSKCMKATVSQNHAWQCSHVSEVNFCKSHNTFLSCST